VRRRSVEIGRSRQSGIEILRGLEEGERVVTAGVRRLTDGERVLVQEDETAG
jgi:multidrug efflux pump subunit AcrA (membrane-fusion protein)